MKRFLLLRIITCLLMTGFAQTDSTARRDTIPEADTIRVGGMIIIRKGKDREIIRDGVRIPKRENVKSNVSTNWWIFDIGFSNYNDETNYSSAETQAFAPGSDKDWFKARSGKSRNVNIWFFMQRINIAKNVVNLKYGLGLELNNYHFERDIVFQKKPTLVTMSATEFSKNKLAADYLTVPMMLNFNFTPNRHQSFGFSAGVSAGYLYSARHKTKTNNDKNKTRSDFDLNKWKISYVGELLLGPVKLYGSYALENMWDKGLNQTPYTVGFRLSNW